MSKYIKELNKSIPHYKDNDFYTIWDEYERVILRSIITTFGLDFIIKDITGGDVDTILNVRETYFYRNDSNAQDYYNLPAYNSKEYHKDSGYADLIKEAKKSQEFIDDGYVPGGKVYYGKSSYLEEMGLRANLDHVEPAVRIHYDKGRVLAEVDGKTLANHPDNLVFTNEHLNKSMGSDTIPDYIAKHPELSEETRNKMLAAYTKSKESYEKTIKETYYTSDKFLADATTAAAKLGTKIAIRQAVGFIMVELWISCKHEILKLSKDSSYKEYIVAIKSGVENGITIVKEKYKELINSFTQGLLAGIINSFATTIINIFIVSDKKMVRNLRQATIYITEAGNVLLFNPNNLSTGDRIKLTTVILGSGACSIIGLNIGDVIDNTPLATIPEVGPAMKTFVTTFVSGILSCTLLLLLSRNKIVNDVIEKLNEYKPTETAIIEISKEFKRHSYELNNLNSRDFFNEIDLCYDNIMELCESTEEEVLIKIITNWIYSSDDNLPWEGDFDEFMSNPNNKLRFN